MCPKIWQKKALFSMPQLNPFIKYSMSCTYKWSLLPGFFWVGIFFIIIAMAIMRGADCGDLKSKQLWKHVSDYFWHWFFAIMFESMRIWDILGTFFMEGVVCIYDSIFWTIHTKFQSFIPRIVIKRHFFHRWQGNSRNFQ